MYASGAQVAETVAGRAVLPRHPSPGGIWDGRAAYSGQMKVRDVIRLLLNDGWFRVATRGSHHQYKHPTKPGRVTVPGSGNDDLAPGTLASILKQADLRRPGKE